MTDNHAVKGLRIDVYRNAAARRGATTHRGITGVHTTLTVIGVIDASDRDWPRFSPVSGWREHVPSPAAPPVAVVVKPLWRAAGKHCLERHAFLVPVIVRPNGTVTCRDRWANGGNFAGTHDSRFAQEIARLTGYYSPGILPVHDHPINQEM